MRNINGLIKIFQEPLLHFLVIGSLLFILFYMVNPSQSGKETIMINDEQLERMITVFQKEWNRQPSEEELKGLLDRYIQQEVYYRKAVNMNLDQNDEVIKRRMEQKLRFLTNDMANLTQPAEADLMDFYKANRDKYQEPKQYSFSHIFFNTDKRSNAFRDAQNLLKSLKLSNTNLEELIQNGDQFPLAYEIDGLSKNEINLTMGDGFTDELDKFPAGKWTGPVLSGYGFHLVYIKSVKESVEKDFDKIKEVVLRDYQYYLQNEYNSQLMEEFKKDFTIELRINNPQNNKQLISKLLAANEN